MGFFSNLFSKKKDTAAVEPQPVQMPDNAAQEEKKPKHIVKTQRFILDDVESHMEDIMELVDFNEDYKLKKRDLLEDNRIDEEIFKYELNTKPTINTISCEGGVEQIQVFVYDTHIGNIKQGSVKRVKNILKKEVQRIGIEVSGGEYKMLTVWNDEYDFIESDKPFSITIEISYLEEIKE
nr:hypothetical protein [uncultured Acetatifactor sp.]